MYIRDISLFGFVSFGKKYVINQKIKVMIPNTIHVYLSEKNVATLNPFQQYILFRLIEFSLKDVNALKKLEMSLNETQCQKNAT